MEKAHVLLELQKLEVQLNRIVCEFGQAELHKRQELLAEAMRVDQQTRRLLGQLNHLRTAA